MEPNDINNISNNINLKETHIYEYNVIDNYSNQVFLYNLKIKINNRKNRKNSKDNEDNGDTSVFEDRNKEKQDFLNLVKIIIFDYKNKHTNNSLEEKLNSDDIETIIDYLHLIVNDFINIIKAYFDYLFNNNSEIGNISKDIELSLDCLCGLSIKSNSNSSYQELLNLINYKEHKNNEESAYYKIILLKILIVSFLITTIDKINTSKSQICSLQVILKLLYLKENENNNDSSNSSNIHDKCNTEIIVSDIIINQLQHSSNIMLIEEILLNYLNSISNNDLNNTLQFLNDLLTSKITVNINNSTTTIMILSNILKQEALGIKVKEKIIGIMNMVLYNKTYSEYLKEKSNNGFLSNIKLVLIEQIEDITESDLDIKLNLSSNRSDEDYTFNKESGFYYNREKLKLIVDNLHFESEYYILVYLTNQLISNIESY